MIKKLIAGVDEVGRGAWAGPLVAAAVIMPNGKKIRGVRDSKQLTPQQRLNLFPKVSEQAISCVVTSVSVAEVDQLGVHQANLFALSHCISLLEPEPRLVLIDGFKINHYLLTKTIIHGDDTEYVIACASIVAKVIRDQLMQGLDALDDRYAFGQHKGYGTALHQQRLQEFGVSCWHRRSFAPIQQLLYT